MQFGTPDEIYHTPANEFVASFVGEPPMSFLDVHLLHDAGFPRLVVSGTDAQPVKLDLGEKAASILTKSPAAAVLRLGVRASDISLSLIRSETHMTPAEVYVVETLGHRDIVTVKIGKDLVKVIAPSGIGLGVRDTVWLNISPRTYHLFHDEQAVSHPVDEICSPQGV
jgi:multiple sugar transport system ATP-binding protein